MSDFRIGKKGSLPPPAPPDVAPTKAFTEALHKGAATEPALSAAKAESAQAESAQAGKLSVEAYVDAKVEAATQHLAGLAPDKVSFIKETLRARLLEDPDLAAWVRHAADSGDESAG